MQNTPRFRRIANCSLLIAMVFSFQISDFGYAQSVTFGIYGRLSPDNLTPTLEATYPIEDWTLGLRAQRDAFGVSAESALELGPAGRVGYGVQANLGFAGWGVGGFVKGGVNPVALEIQLAYASTLRSNLWVGDVGPAGLSGSLDGKYRLSRNETAGVFMGYTGIWTGEGTYALRDSATYTFGLGYRNGVYGILGWKGELDDNGTLLEALLRAGFRNELEAAYFTALDDATNLKLRLTLAYPLAATLSMDVNDIRLDAAYDGGFSIWLRYTLNLGGE